MSGTIKLAVTDDEIRSCYPVMSQLRSHLDEKRFCGQVRRQMDTFGYELPFLYDGEGVQAVGGIRISECLAWGRFLYIDDLVTGEHSRSAGHGAALFNWIRDYAITNGCAQLHLDSGVQRFGAHRFYLNQRMNIDCHHFSMVLE